jgi:trigger factor
MTKDELQQIKVEKKENSSVAISGELPFSYLEKHKTATLKDLGKNVDIPGFRKGHVPEKKLVEHIGETALLQGMAERALSETYPEIVKEHELDVIGYPQIGITKLAENNPLGFTATVAVMPEITLPDYKKISHEINEQKEPKEVTDEDVDAQIKDILRQKVAYERLQEKAAQRAEAEKKDDDNLGGTTELPTPETIQKDDAEEKEPPLPELTDEYVKTLGQPGQFESVEDFKKKLREHLEIQKAQEVASAHRAKITDAIIEKSDLDIPQVMIDAEMNQMSAQMEDDLKRAELTMDGYLAHVKKTKEDLIKEWTPAATKRAKLQLILNEIAKKENVSPDPSAVDHEADHLMEQYKDADKDRVKVYVESVLTNEEVMKLLEQS